MKMGSLWFIVFMLFLFGIILPNHAQCFEKPTINNVHLRKCCIALIKDHSERLELAGATQKLIAWSPLISLIGEDKTVSAAMSIKSTDWEILGKSINAVSKLVFSTLATEAIYHADLHNDDEQLHKFWEAMSKHYASHL